MNPLERDQILESFRQKKVYDLLVIGGGATGCGVALDAASRGLSVALVEQDDFAEGTSGRSTKLLHGGVRYLESAVKHLDPVQYHLVKDGLRERGILLSIAPHLCHSIPLVTPLYHWLEVPYVFAGLKLYDVLAGSWNIGHSRLLSRSQALTKFPMLKARGLKAGVSYYDGQFNDARMAVALALTAVNYGAVVVNHVKAQDLLKKKGLVAGAELIDGITGEEFHLFARAVVNATGPFADTVRRIDNPACPPLLRVSSGTHLVLDSRFSPPGTGLLIPKTRDGRVLFILPWEGRTVVGTTDEPSSLSEHPKPMEEEIDYLIHYIHEYFSLRFAKDDIKSAWAGLRPLVSDPRKADTAKLSRDHVLEESPSGLLTITGGKWTTYRKMACDTVNYAVKRFKLNQKKGCWTERIPLIGGEHFEPGGGAHLAESQGVDFEVADHLNRSYGDRASNVVSLSRENPEKRLVEGYPYLEAEIIWAVRYEMALRPMDVLARRIPLALLDVAAAGTAARRTMEIMADELDWGPERWRQEEQEVQERLTSAI